MADIDSRTVNRGRYFTESENNRSAYVCLIGDDVVQQFFGGVRSAEPGDPDRTTRSSRVIGTFEAIGSVLGPESGQLRHRSA